jgi:hypothetical protein
MLQKSDLNHTRKLTIEDKAVMPLIAEGQPQFYTPGNKVRGHFGQESQVP